MIINSRILIVNLICHRKMSVLVSRLARRSFLRKHRQIRFSASFGGSV